MGKTLIPFFFKNTPPKSIKKLRARNGENAFKKLGHSFLNKRIVESKNPNNNKAKYISCISQRSKRI